MTRLNPNTALKVFVLLVLAALPISTTTGRASSPPPPVVPVQVVNPTPADCYAGAGCLDPTFGVSGKAFQDVGGSLQVAYVMAAQPDGKLVVAGSSNRYADYATDGLDRAWTIARFAPDGTLDTGFGSGGIIKIDYLAAEPNLQQARGVAIQSDGKIVVGGWGTGGGTTYAAVLRFTASGSPDPTYGSGGKASVNMGGGIVTGMKMQPDGKILLCAGSGTVTIARLKTNGAVDTSFGSNGFRQIANFNSDAVTLQSNGKIILGGVTTSPYDFVLYRLTSSGSVDSSFGSGGKATVNFYGQADYITWGSIAIAADDSIVAAGYAQSTSDTSSQNMAFARFTATGAVQNAFGTSGKVVLDMHGGVDIVQAVAFQADGKIVFAGRAKLPDGSRDFGIVGRLAANGTLDPSFGAGGITETDYGLHSQLMSLATANGKITVAGYLYTTTPSDQGPWLLGRYIQ